MSLLIITHDDCLGHRPPDGHPERPARLEAVMRGLNQLSGARMESARPITRDELDRTHGRHYLDKIEQLDEAGQQLALDADTHFGPGTLRAIKLAAGAACQGVDQVLNGAARRAFAAVRPPGHHAESARAMGFCIYSNIAVAACHAVAAHGLQRVAVVDFDVHHGNGSEAILAGNENVLFLSSHQSPLYPGTGQPDTPHASNVRNAVLPPASGSNEFRDLWLEHLLPEIDRYRPQLVLVSAGFDAHWRDPLAQLQLKDDDYYWIGERLVDLAERRADGRLVASLEGGYDLKALEASALAFAEALH